MATQGGGSNLEDIEACQTRECFLEKDGAQIVQTTPQSDGGLSETYRFPLKRSSAARAFMHGTLDVATLGIWEVAGTPIEAMKDKKLLVLTATYRKDNSLAQVVLGMPSSPATASAAPTGQTGATVAVRPKTLVPVKPKTAAVAVAPSNSPAE